MIMRGTWAAALAALTLVGCGGESSGERAAEAEADTTLTWNDVQQPGDRIASIEGFAGPESVRYDPDQDVWFVGNFSGDGNERDGDGFVSRVSAETAEIEDLRFATGTDLHPLHAARGMFITGDTLWVADIDGVHGFDRRTGEALAFVDLTALEPGFLNDIVQGPDSALYVTDTRKSAVYRIAGGEAAPALADTLLGGPNGITWDPARGVLVLVPWQPGHRVLTWQPGQAPQGFGPNSTPGRLDGVEAIDRRLLIASQADSAIHLMDGGGTQVVIEVDGAPADIGVDVRRRRVAVPYVALNRVDVFSLPPVR